MLDHIKPGISASGSQESDMQYLTKPRGRGYDAHRYRTGGDLGHIDRNNPEPRRLLGAATWANEARAEIELMKVETLAAELEDLDRRNRRKDLEKRRIEGPRDPWRASRHGPMRELILTANKDRFEQTESSEVEFSTSREELFEERAVAWLRENFGDDVIHARADLAAQPQLNFDAFWVDLFFRCRTLRIVGAAPRVVEFKQFFDIGWSLDRVSNAKAAVQALHSDRRRTACVRTAS